MSHQKSCLGCIKLDACKFFEVATQLKTEFDGRHGEIVKLPLEPKKLAENCPLYLEISKTEQAKVRIPLEYLMRKLREAKQADREAEQLELQEVIRGMYEIPEGATGV